MHTKLTSAEFLKKQANAWTGVQTFSDGIRLGSTKKVIREASVSATLDAISSQYDSGYHIRSVKVHAQDIDYEDSLFDAAGLTDSANIFAMPANAKLIAVVMQLRTQFAGPSLTDMKVTIGLAGDNDGVLMSTGMNMVSDAQWTEYDTLGAYYGTFTEGIANMTRSAITWVAYATAVGCNLNALTAGRLLFYFLYEERG